MWGGTGGGRGVGICMTQYNFPRFACGLRVAFDQPLSNDPAVFSVDPIDSMPSLSIIHQQYFPFFIKYVCKCLPSTRKKNKRIILLNLNIKLHSRSSPGASFALLKCVRS